MPKITWHGEGGDGPPFCTWNGITFPVGVAVEVNDDTMIRKAKGNHFFKVEGAHVVIEPTGAKAAATQWREPATEADPADVSFFDDPPSVDESPNPLDYPPDYPPEEEPKRKRGRPPKVKANGDH